MQPQKKEIKKQSGLKFQAKEIKLHGLNDIMQLQFENQTRKKSKDNSLKKEFK